MPTSHIFTVDVEEYFQAKGFGDIVPVAEWESLPSRVERAVDQILVFLDRHGVRATFFVNVWLAESHPQLIRRIGREGHEIGAGGRRLREARSRIDPDRFRDEVRRCKETLESITGRRVLGFRSPDLSFPLKREDAYDALIQTGYSYDSSLLPTGTEPDDHGSAPREDPHLIQYENGTVLELPLTTMEIMGIRLPAAGGANFRQLPFAYTERAVQARVKEGAPVVFRIRSWEVDRFQPRLPTSPLRRVRHYWGLDRTLPRLERLVSKYRFTSVERFFHLPYREWDAIGIPTAGGTSERIRTRQPHRNKC